MSRRPIIELLSGGGRLLRPASVPKTISIQVGAAAALRVTVTPSWTKGYTGRELTVTAAWSDATIVPPFNVTFDWGDGLRDSKTGLYSQTLTLTHTYADAAAGVKTITVTVLETATGRTGSGTASVEVRLLLTVDFTADKTSGPAPLAVTFTCSAGRGYSPYSWTLDYGDGSTVESGSGWNGTAFTKTHTYTQQGSYTATLTVTDTLGTAMQAQLTIGSGFFILFPNLRKFFPRIFGKVDEVRQKVRGKMPASEEEARSELAVQL